MKRILPLAAALLCLAATRPAAAALDADVVLVYGSSWRRVLPVYPAVAGAPQRGSKAVSDLPPVILWSEGEERWTEELVRRLAAKKIALVGPPGITAGKLKLPGKVQVIDGDDATIDSQLANVAFTPTPGAPPRAIYLADGADYGAALAASALATAWRGPLLVADGDINAAAAEAGALARKLGAEWVVVVGNGDASLLASAAGRKVRVISRDEALAAYGRKVGATDHLVVTAPADTDGAFTPPKLSLAAVPYAIGRGAALGFAGAGLVPDPNIVRSPEEAAAAIELAGGGPFGAVSVVGDTVTLPMREVPDIDQVARGIANPRIHKVPAFVDPFGTAADRAVGRLAALDVFDLSRWVARIVHPELLPKDRKGALVLANAHDKFVLGETISRTTSSEMKNAGVDVQSYYRSEIDHDLIQRELPGHALVLWEGHPRDLTLDDDAIPAPDVPLPPATFFLQGCYTLDRSDPYLLVERGANAVIGSYMAVYSASGSGFARTWLNSQLHDGETAGEALASARNYLLATVELKKRRGLKDWRKTLRAALSFELWGDPTAPLPVTSGRLHKQPVKARVRGKQLTVTVPAGSLPRAIAGDYFARVRPGSALSAIYDENPPEGGKRLVELFFVEVDVPKEFGDAPQVTGPYDPSTYAWVFSPRTRKLSLLIHENALPAPGKAATLKFELAKAP